MKNTSKKIVFFGTENFSAHFLVALIDAGYDICAVITKPDTAKGRGHKIIPPAVKTIAHGHNIPVWQPEKLKDIIEHIKALQPVAGVLVSYGKIVPQNIIEPFTPGIINVHPSLLPKYRGPSPIESAILNGDHITGVSIMQLVKSMDAGPVYSQVELPLDGTESKLELYDRLASVGVKELLKVLPSIISEQLQPAGQVEAEATYCHLLQKSDGLLDPTTQTAAQAERRVRAFLGFPKTRLNILGELRIVTKAHVADQPKTALDVQFADGKFLSVDELVAPSGKAITAEAFLRGYSS